MESGTKNTENKLPPLSSPTIEVDVAFLVFIERYATDLLKWDIFTFFAHNPNVEVPASKIAKQIGRNVDSVYPELGDLVLLRILKQQQGLDGQILYQLTEEPYFRKMTLKFSDQVIKPFPAEN